MLRYIAKRLLMLIPILLGMSLIIFTMMYITPGDPARQILGADASQESVDQLRDELGLNDSFVEQYVRYVLNAAQGDFGTSYTTGMSVTEEVLERFPTTLLFAILCSLVAVLIGIPLGIISATKQYSPLDYIASILALVGISIPGFWLGLMLIIVFSLNLHWFPSSGFYGPSYWVLPSLTIGLVTTGTIMRMTRSSMLEVVRQDYIRTARAKGQKEHVIILKHALKNALIPVVTVVGLQFGRAMGGAIISEQIFSIPGLGKLMVESIANRNYPVVQGGVIFIAIAFSLVNLFVDILYAYIDPRLKSQFATQSKPKAKPLPEKKST